MRFVDFVAAGSFGFLAACSGTSVPSNKAVVDSEPDILAQDVAVRGAIQDLVDGTAAFFESERERQLADFSDDAVRASYLFPTTGSANYAGASLVAIFEGDAASFQSSNLDRVPARAAVGDLNVNVDFATLRVNGAADNFVSVANPDAALVALHDTGTLPDIAELTSDGSVDGTISLTPVGQTSPLGEDIFYMRLGGEIVFPDGFVASADGRESFQPTSDSFGTLPGFVVEIDFVGPNQRNLLTSGEALENEVADPTNEFVFIGAGIRQ